MCSVHILSTLQLHTPAYLPLRMCSVHVCMCVLAVDVQVLPIAKYMSKLVHTTAYSYNVAKLSLKFQAAMFALCVY